MTTTTNDKKPRETLRDGSLKASIWRNQGEKGTFYSVQITRTWKDEQGVYHDSDRFSGSELLRLSHLATQAYDRVAQLRNAYGDDAAVQDDGTE